jgi:hypothetical protein
VSKMFTPRRAESAQALLHGIRLGIALRFVKSVVHLPSLFNCRDDHAEASPNGEITHRPTKSRGEIATIVYVQRTVAIAQATRESPEGQARVAWLMEQDLRLES